MIQADELKIGMIVIYHDEDGEYIRATVERIDIENKQIFMSDDELIGPWMLPFGDVPKDVKKIIK